MDLIKDEFRSSVEVLEFRSKLKKESVKGRVESFCRLRKNDFKTFTLFL